MTPNASPSLTISKTLDYTLCCSIIPVLLSQIDIKSNSLYTYLSRYISIPHNYKLLITQIENNMKNNNLSMASLTIETKKAFIPHITKKKTLRNHTLQNTNSTKHSTKHSTTSVLHVHQLYIIAIKSKSQVTNIGDNFNLLELARVSGNAIFNILKSNQINYVNIVDSIDNYDSISKTVSRNTKFIEALLEGLFLSSYQFLKYKTSNALTKNKDKFSLARVNIVIPYKHIETLNIEHKFMTLDNQIKSVFLARDLINEPANKTKAASFINIITTFIKEHNVPITIEILEKKELEKLGMGLILGVGSGSNTENAPRIVILKYNGNTHNDKKHNDKKHNDKKHNNKHPEYVLLGKGITFDTGGLDIKGTRSMSDMKTDLSGAATVISFLIGYAMNKGEKCIYSVCPFAENSVGPNSTKPSDVIKAYNGITVEVSNTDAEGRLVLADCLSYVVDKYPTSILIDFATLTGAQETLSCKMFSNVLSVNSNIEVAKLIKSGIEINEMLVELPMMEKYLKNLESYVADIKNDSSTCSADIIMSSLFMRQFVKKHTKWIHIDIAGPSYKANDIIKYASPEASGIGVRLLFTYFES